MDTHNRQVSISPAAESKILLCTREGRQPVPLLLQGILFPRQASSYTALFEGTLFTAYAVECHMHHRGCSCYGDFGVDFNLL